MSSTSKNIFRSPKNKLNPYLSISRDLISNSNLNPYEFQILCFMLSMPDDWQFNVSHIADSLNLNRKTVESHMKGLIEKQFVLRWQARGGKGHFLKYTYLIFESPQLCQEFLREQFTQKPSQVQSEPQTISPRAVEQPILSNEITKEEYIRKSPERRKKSSSSSFSLKEKIERRQRAREEQISLAVNDLDPEKRQSYEFMISKGVSSDVALISACLYPQERFFNAAYAVKEYSSKRQLTGSQAGLIRKAVEQGWKPSPNFRP